MKFPKPLKITSRTSTITNAFVQAIIPYREPADEQKLIALSHFGMTLEAISCCYCGDKATDWDHLRPLVQNKQPTGYISDFLNFVPSCAPCNQSKSGAEWRAWINGNARKSPRSRKIANLDDRIEKLKRFEEWGNVEKINIEKLVDKSLYDEYLTALKTIKEEMVKAQKIADRVRQQIADRLVPAQLHTPV